MTTENKLYLHIYLHFIFRSNYWIPACRGIILSVIASGLYCTKERIKLLPTFISKILQDRLCFDKKPFPNIGVDHLGPYHIKLYIRNRFDRATAKRYVVLFTCLSTSAAYLKIVGDLFTNTFIVGLRSFVSRRGNVNIIRLDNGTNFIDASKQLNQAIKNIDQSSVKHITRNKEYRMEILIHQ